MLLLQAAERGAGVRPLLDDFHTSGLDPPIVALGWLTRTWMERTSAIERESLRQQLAAKRLSVSGLSTPLSTQSGLRRFALGE